jgi:phosphoglycerate dehydrogenase-like enzyme
VKPNQIACIALVLAALAAGLPAAARADAGESADVRARAARMAAELGLVEAPAPVSADPRWRRPTRIVVRAESPAVLAALAPLAPGVELVPARDEAEAAAAMPGAQAIIGFCNAAVVGAGDRLHWVQLFSAGSEGCVGVPAVRERDVLVTNMQRISSPEIAEHVLALLLAFTRGLHVHIPAQQAGRWDEDALPRERTWELGGRTLLVVGLGGIGTAVARRAKALGMRVVATRASDRPAPPFVDRVAGPDGLLALAAEADAVVNTAPLTPETTGLFDARFFGAMKPTAYFINVGRGRSVVTADLVAALRAGRIAGAGLDVVDPEPLPPDHPLWRLPNVIVTPHVAASSDKVFARVLLLAQENLRRYVVGEPLLSVVDTARGY